MSGKRGVLRSVFVFTCILAYVGAAHADEAILKEKFLAALHSVGGGYSAKSGQDGESSVAMVSSPFYHVGACKRVQITLVENAADAELNAFPFVKSLLIAQASSSEACEEAAIEEFFYTDLVSVRPKVLLDFIGLVQQGGYYYEASDEKTRFCMSEGAHTLVPAAAGQTFGSRGDPSRIEISFRGCGLEAESRRVYISLDVDESGNFSDGFAMIAAAGTH